jgi:hypothetical protein
MIRISSLLKNLKSGASSVFCRVLGLGGQVCSLLATVSRVVSGRGLHRQQFGNADQIVGDQIEHEIDSDTGYAAMFGLALVPCCLPQPKMHSVIARRDCDMP